MGLYRGMYACTHKRLARVSPVGPQSKDGQWEPLNLQMLQHVNMTFSKVVTFPDQRAVAFCHKSCHFP
jgi:hypothetical protein